MVIKNFHDYFLAHPNNMQIYTTDKSSPRGFGWLWFLRLLAIFFTLVVLGITVRDVADFHSASCSAPSRLGYNLAVSVLSCFALIYFSLATGPKPIFRLLPWIIWGQIALDGLMLILWLAAVATSSYSCNALCNACAGADNVNYNNQYCACSNLDSGFDDPFKRSYPPKPRGLLGGRRPPSHHLSSSSSSQDNSSSTNSTKKAFDAIMTIIFAVCLAATLFGSFKQRSSNSNKTTIFNIANPNVDEAGTSEAGASAPYSDQQGASAGNYNAQSVGQEAADLQQSMPQTVVQQQDSQQPSASVPAAKEIALNETSN